MAQRDKCMDLDEQLAAGAALGFVDASALASVPAGSWTRVRTEYKTEHSANASASIFRRKLGRDRVRVAARGRFVYVYFKPAEEVAEAA